MYVFIVIALMLALPLISIVAQIILTDHGALQGAESLFFVRELGFANVAIGSVGIASLFAASWVTPAALLGAIYYGLAGINHCFHKGRNKLQNLALVTDLFAAVVLATCCFA